MENNFFKLVKQTLTSEDIKTKFKLFESLEKKIIENKVNFNIQKDIEVFKKPSYSNFCNIVDTKSVPQRKNIASKEGQQILLHAIAHIEYSAIDLALDACYRFQDMPKEFYLDWIEVASDEIRHFSMINNELEKLDIKYGDIDVHQGLFEASMRSLELIPRMALIPRYMEANGLDANAMMIEKLKKVKNTKHIIDLLEVILDEEIDHVKKGDKWYKYACHKKENFICDYFQIVMNIYPNSFNTNKHINEKARKLAGFSDEEIEKLKTY